MHYGNLLIIEKTENIAAAVQRAMGPDEENGGFWDWYQIGGRWTGALDGYKPDEDPRNVEQCEQCHGTGFREDEIGLDARCGNSTYTCNGCGTFDEESKRWKHGKHGPGKRTVWPTRFADHPGDIAPIESVTEEAYKAFFRVVIGRGLVFGGQQYLPWKEIGQTFPKNEMPPLDWLKREYAGHLVVVVDNHC